MPVQPALDLGERRGPRRWIWIGVAAAAIAAIGVFVFTRSDSAAEPIGWRTVPIERGDIRALVSATGQLEPESVVEIGAEISGRIAAVEVDYNDEVELGQVLARIDTERLDAELEQVVASQEAAAAATMQANATLTETKQNLDRAVELNEAQAVSARDLETARATFERARAALRSSKAQEALARAKVRSVRTDIQKAVITSPIRGVVLSRNIEPGNTVVVAMQSPVLFEVAAELSRMLLDAAIDEADVARVQVGQEAEFSVDAWPGQKFAAKVQSLRLAPTITNNVVTYTAVLALDNKDGRLRPGLTATAEIVTQTESNVLTVPNVALRFTPARQATRSMFGGPPRAAGPRGPAGPTVWILKNGAPSPVSVSLGATDGVKTAVSGEGLADDDQVVVGTDAS